MTTAAPYALAFPDMTDMPAIPAAWSDVSWRNDACPRFLVAGYPWGACVDCWIDYPSPEARETGAEGRYTLVWTEDTADEGRGIYVGDDWNEVLRLANVERLAWRFAHTLATDMDANDWCTMRLRNGEYEPGLCASHEFRDSNMDMHSAFLEEFDRDPLTDIGISDNDVALWNEAWTIAKTHHLSAKPGSYAAAFDMWRLTCTEAHGVRLYGPGEIDLVEGGKFHCAVSNLSELFDTSYDAERYLWAMFACKEWEFGFCTNAAAPAPVAPDLSDVLAIITDGADLLDAVNATTTDNGRAFLYLADGRTVRVTAEIV